MTTMWRTKDGREIAITKMDENHLLNTIKMLIRKGAFAREANALQYCHYLDSHDGGDGAHMALEAELNQALDTDTIGYLCETNPTFQELFVEWAEHRGIGQADYNALLEYQEEWQRRALGYVFNKLRK